MDTSTLTTGANTPARSGVNSPVPDPSSRHGPARNGPPRVSASRDDPLRDASQVAPSWSTWSPEPRRSFETAWPA
ncbi:hypothetical protein, partial [Embleya sp. NPDC005575]|uniref:hypothetical protein n=1 Tax=Embleya sp. NPDC005575 TaxID=3156892 RepID=UPI0033BAE542